MTIFYIAESYLTAHNVTKEEWEPVYVYTLLFINQADFHY